MRFTLVRTCISTLLLMTALSYEQAAPTRAAILYGLCAVFIVLPFLRGKNHARWPGTLLADIFIINCLSYYSRFTVNHVVIALNIVVIIEAMLWQSWVYGSVVSLVTVLASAMGFVVVFQYGMNYQLLTQAVFAEVVFALVWGLLTVIRSYLTEKRTVQELNRALEIKNEALVEANDGLKESQRALEHAGHELARLSRLQERSELARNLHDSVGHEMTGLIMALEMVKMQVGTMDKSDVAAELQTITTHAREILSIIRGVVESMVEQADIEDLHAVLSTKLVQFQSQTGITLYFDDELQGLSMSSDIKGVVYRITLEALTNIARHSNGKTAWVSLQRIKDAAVLLKITDSGSNDKPLAKGNGLRFIEERVKKHGGQVQITSDSSGFGITVMLPLEDRLEPVKEEQL